jgi:hypothetical protein
LAAVSPEIQSTLAPIALTSDTYGKKRVLPKLAAVNPANRFMVINYMVFMKVE